MNVMYKLWGEEMAILNLKVEEGWGTNESSLESTVKDYITQLLTHDYNLMLLNITRCESPIEKLMCLALTRRMDVDLFSADDGCYMINVQEKIELPNKKRYRVDFLINASYKGVERKVVLECDGHDFHERTKEQAKRDRQRDRDLITAGYEVVRFTGSEIFENPSRCARQVSQIVFKE